MPHSHRLHVTHNPLTAVKPVRQSATPSRKPNGLWYAFGDHWQALLSSGSVKGKQPGTLAYEITLSPEARVCVLSTVDEVLAFTEAYGRALPWAHPGAPTNKCVDWQAVAEMYQGIEVSCLDRAGRRYLDWLDIDWAVASGCIWDPRAVQSITETETPACQSF